MNTILDLRSSLMGARDQGDRPTCIAFATSDAHALARASYAPLSAEYLFFSAAQRISDWTQGVTPSEIATALRSDGQPEEAAWQYSLTHPTPWVVPTITSPIWTHPCSAVQATVSDFTASLVAGVPVVLCLKITESFQLPTAPEFIIRRDASPVVGYHAVLLAGMGTSSGNETCFLIRNSWGQAWGDDGYAWLTDEFVRANLIRVIELK